MEKNKDTFICADSGNILQVVYIQLHIDHRIIDYVYEFYKYYTNTILIVN